MRTDAIIRFDHVSKSYGENLVLADFNLSINKGEFVTVIGSSGSGKTTMLKMINGLLTPTLGTIYVDGKDIARENQTLLRRNIGYVIQGIGLFPHMNVRKNIAYVPELLNRRDKKRTARAVERLIEVVGLEREMLERYPAELSGGQRQRIGIARALAVEPEVLLMDEPTSALDPISTSRIEELAMELKKDYTIVMVTHNMQQAARISDKTAFFLLGDMVEFGPTEKIFSMPQDRRTEDYITGRFG